MSLQHHPVDRLEVWSRLCLILALLLAVAAPVTADWLSLRDGTRIETDGGWVVDEGLVKFQLPNRSGRFSLRAAKVDLAASEALTRRQREAARAPAQPAATPRKRPVVLVLTDRDVRKVKRRPAAPAEETAPQPGSPAAGEEAPIDPPRRFGSGLEVATWRQSESLETGAVVIEGELRNRGRGLAIGLELTVSLTTADGAVVASRAALLSSSTLAPNQRSRFRAVFTELVDFSDVEFEVGPPSIAYLKILEPERESPLASG